MKKIILYLTVILLLPCIALTHNKEKSLLDILPISIYIEGEKEIDTTWYLKHTFRHSLLKKEAFPERESPTLNFIAFDTNRVSISDGKISIQYGEDTLEFEDMPEDEYGYYSIYEYEGKIDILNSFLISNQFLETSGYSLYNADDYTQEYSFSYLAISPDGKYMLTVEFDGIDSPETYWNYYYKIENSNLTPIATLVYRGWRPIYPYSYDCIVWDENNCIYIPIVSVGDYYNTNWQERVHTLKIEVKFEDL